MPHLLNADWAVYALAKRADTLKTLDQLAPEGIFLSWVTVGEIYEGARAARGGDSTLPRFVNSSAPPACLVSATRS